MMEASEKAKLLKELADEARMLSNRRIRDRIPPVEAELVRTELVCIAKRLVDRYKLTIPDARRALHELLDVSV
jgi:hypothetical protein